MPDFNDFLRNGTHDWLSRPYSMYGWRLSGGHRVFVQDPSSLYHAGLDFMTFQCMYLEPVLAFLVDGEKPAAAGREWTPAELAGFYRAGKVKLDLRVTLPNPDGLLAQLTIKNESRQAKSFVLTAYGEPDRHIDTEDSIDIHIKGGGYGKNLLHAAHRRQSPRGVVAECYGDTADSHRGGLTNYAKFRVRRWHHSLSASPIGIALPEGGQPEDRAGQWRQSWRIALKPGESREMLFSLSAAYQARTMPEEAMKADVLDKARALAGLDYAEVISQNVKFWQEMLERVPPPLPELDKALQQMYYRAWTCIWQLVTPGFDTGRIDGLAFKDAFLVVTKADHRAVMPADWETGLGALLLAQVDAPLAAKIFDGLMAAVEPDGYTPENLVSTKENMLPFLSSYIQWQIYRRTGDKAWLARHYATQKSSLWAHYRNPNFKRRGMPTLRNLVYVHIGFIYLHKIAVELNLDAREVEYCRWLVDETEQVVQNFWDPERKFFCDAYQDRGSSEEQDFIPETSVQCMVSLFAGANAEQVPFLLRDLKEKYFAGEYGIRESGNMGGAAPEGKSLAESDLSKVNTYKHGNFLYFIPGLEKWDLELCREVCLRTLRGIALNGDFHEQMRCNMERKAFGPMAVFGAFGYIQCAQTLAQIGLPSGKKTPA